METAIWSRPDLPAGSVFEGPAIAEQLDATIVVPPAAAAHVPDSKVSAAVVPMNGISRCVCGSIPPGIT